jgi:hypothetical protein
VILCTVIVTSALVGAPSAPQVTPASRPEELVRLLGDKSFRIREGAATELVRRGSASVAALAAGTKDPDPEVSERSRQLLPQAEAAERNEKIAKLLRDPKAPPPKGLAGLPRFLAATGDSKEARELYAEMMAVHARTVELAETDPKAAAELFLMFGNEAYQKWQAGARVGRYSYDNMFGSKADIAYFLFLSADDRVRARENGPNYSSILLNGTQIPKAINEKDGSPAMRGLFLHWLEHEPNMQGQGFQLATQAGLKEALPQAIKLLQKKDDRGGAWNKAQIMTTLIKLGTKDQIKLLDPFLKDETHVSTISFGNGPTLSVQMRDVAMAVQIQLAGQKLGDYGYDTRFGGASSYHYYGFQEEENGKSKARDEAHAKWAEWKKKNADKLASAKPVGQPGPMPHEQK